MRKIKNRKQNTEFSGNKKKTKESTKNKKKIVGQGKTTAIAINNNEVTTTAKVNLNPIQENVSNKKTKKVNTPQDPSEMALKAAKGNRTFIPTNTNRTSLLMNRYVTTMMSSGKFGMSVG